jgi:hypothetical protein
MGGGLRNANSRDDKRTALVAVLFSLLPVENRLAGGCLAIYPPLKSILSGHTIYFGSKARLVSCGGVVVKHAFLNRSVDQRYCLS